MLSQRYAFEAAQRLANNELVIMKNRSVYAMSGNANDPQLQSNIKAVKDSDQVIQGGKRGINQPVGWTAPFSRTLDTVDLSLVSNDAMRRLLGDPHELTGRIGAIAFIRATANLKVKHERNLPDSIIPDKLGAKVQLYSPIGNDATHRFVRLALALGVEPVMTSANISSDKEIVDESAAREFARKAGHLAVFMPGPDDDKDTISGSYPIIGVANDGFTLERAGCFHAGILAALLHDMPFHPITAEGAQPKAPSYPDKVLHLTDLPMRYRNQKGNDLWFGILATLGWHNEFVGLAEAIPDLAPNFPRPASREEVFATRVI